MALWAADCAERVLPYFEEERPKDERPLRAVQAGRAWARGELKVGEGRAAAFAAHVAGHAAAAADYAVKAVAHAAVATDYAVAEEREWQYRRLPERLRPRGSQ